MLPNLIDGAQNRSRNELSLFLWQTTIHQLRVNRGVHARDVA
jgi:hypothetical protein